MLELQGNPPWLAYAKDMNQFIILLTQIFFL